jgi:ParB family chromosome partitioning protein
MEIIRSSSRKAAADEKRSTPQPRLRKEKFEFHVGKSKVTARSGECRIVDNVDYAQMPKDQLERAIRAFQKVLKE